MDGQGNFEWPVVEVPWDEAYNQYSYWNHRTIVHTNLPHHPYQPGLCTSMAAMAWCDCHGSPEEDPDVVLRGKVVLQHNFANVAMAGRAINRTHRLMNDSFLPHIGCEIRIHQVRIFTATEAAVEEWLKFNGTTFRGTYLIIQEATNKVGLH